MFSEKVHIMDHPLVAHKLTIDWSTSTKPPFAWRRRTRS